MARPLCSKSMKPAPWAGEGATASSTARSQQANSERVSTATIRVISISLLLPQQRSRRDRSGSTRDEAVREHGEHETGEKRVLPVVLDGGEEHDRREHPQIGREQEDGDAEADQQARAEPAGGRRQPQIAGEEPQRVRPSEGSIEGRDTRGEAMPDQARDDEREAGDDPAGQHAAHDRVHAVVDLGHPAPRSPRTIISAPRTSRTTRKNRCTVSLLVRSRTRVPANAPAVTPTITGAASPVSSRPEAR